MKIYLDHNASTPIDERVLDAMCACLRDQYGNPSSVHQYGRAARAMIDQAREQVAALVNAHPSQVIFTSGGTEANNLAFKALAADQAPARIAVSAVEHASLLGPARAMQSQSWQLDSIDVDDQCRVSLDALRQQLQADTKLVSIMWANNETGAVQDIPELAGIARSAGAIMHSDAVQAAGKLSIDFQASGLHLMSISAHKLYGPKGVGALVYDKALEIKPLLHGGGQEKGLRGGTENLASIVGFGYAAEIAGQEMTARAQQQHALRVRLEAQLGEMSQVHMFAQAAARLPNTVQLAIAGIEGETLLMQLDKLGIAVSSGSACASSSNEPSHVLTAMGVPTELARGAIRISLGKDTQVAHIDALVDALRQQLAWVHKASSVAGW